jgi:hypothetical protein
MGIITNPSLLTKGRNERMIAEKMYLSRKTRYTTITRTRLKRISVIPDSSIVK